MEFLYFFDFVENSFSYEDDKSECTLIDGALRIVFQQFSENPGADIIALLKEQSTVQNHDFLFLSEDVQTTNEPLTKTDKRLLLSLVQTVLIDTLGSFSLDDAQKTDLKILRAELLDNFSAGESLLEAAEQQLSTRKITHIKKTDLLAKISVLLVLFPQFDIVNKSEI